MMIWTYTEPQDGIIIINGPFEPWESKIAIILREIKNSDNEFYNTFLKIYECLIDNTKIIVGISSHKKTI